VDALVDSTTHLAIEQSHCENEEVDQLIEQLGKPQLVYAETSFFERNQKFRPALQPRPEFIF